MNDLIKIGKLTRLHGIKGGVVLHVTGPDQPDVAKTKCFFIEINSIPTPFFVSGIKASGKNLILSFDSVTTIEAAQKILNCTVSIEKKNAQKNAPVKDLTGYELKDKAKGTLGKINEVVEMPGQKMFSVNINGQEALLPFTENLIIKIDHSLKTILYDAPEGLIDIYTS